MKIESLTVGVIQTNCYIVSNTEGACVIIDPGAEGKKLLKVLTEGNLKLQAILLTHGHFDHMGAASMLRKETGAEVYAGAKEAGLCEDPDQNLYRTFFYQNKGITPDHPVSDDEILDFGEELKFRVIETPGHTAGGVSYLSLTEPAVFSGDTMFQNSTGRTDFPTGSERELSDSITGKLLTLPPETVVYPGHGDATSVSHERMNFRME